MVVEVASRVVGQGWALELREREMFFVFQTCTITRTDAFFNFIQHNDDDVEYKELPLLLFLLPHAISIPLPQLYHE